MLAVILVRSPALFYSGASWFARTQSSQSRGK